MYYVDQTTVRVVGGWAADGMGKSSGSKRNGSRNAIAFRWLDRHLP